MIFPEIEILTTLVARVFRIEDVTPGDAQKGVIVRYRGQLWNEDSAAAYDQLAELLQPYQITPLFRRERDGQQVIFLIPRPVEPKPAPVSVNIILFLLTVFSVMLAGAQPTGPIPSDVGGQMLALLRSILSGWPFAVSLLGILLAHEFGHYLMSRYHKTPATLPYCIPMPFSPLGTMGAAILMQGTPKNKRVLFDIGVAGPLAGIVVALPVLFYGLSLSHLGVIEPLSGTFLEGNSLLYLFAKYLRFRQWLPAPANTGGLPLGLYWLRYFFTGQPFPLGATDVFIHPIAFAGWAGLLVTALNLLPAGTLDGGHVIYAVFGEKASRLFPAILVVLGALGFFWSGWWLWAALLLWLGRVHAEPLDQITTLDPPRRVLAVIVAILFLLTFSPVPFAVFGA